jgi:DNA modification methylase
VTARFIVGDVLEVLRTVPDASVDMVATSPPYPWQRRYLPPDHPDAALERGQESEPPAALASMLDWVDECYRVLTPDGTIWINLGQAHAGSGGAGGDYLTGGMKDGQPRYDGTARRRGDWPMDQSICWLPELLGASMAYGRNLLTGDACRQWVTRPPVTWCKPAVTPGRLGRKFRTATELVVYAGKHEHHYFDLDAVREPHAEHTLRYPRDSEHYQDKGPNEARGDRGRITAPYHPDGAPPFNWWVIGTATFRGAHYAVMPAELLVRPIKAGSPEGGTVLDPFAGTGTVLAVALGHGRDAIGIDLDERNAELALERVGMFLTVEHHEGAAA